MRCEICRTYTVEHEVGVVPNRCETELPSKLRALFGGDSTDHFTYDVCRKCLVLIRNTYPDRLVFTRPKRPRYSLTYRGLRLWSMFRILMEMAFHGVSWWEANGLDEWLIPETILVTNDHELYQLWAEYNLGGALLMLTENVASLEQRISERLCLVWCLHRDKLAPLVPKLRYIFRKYSKAYVYGHPPDWSPREWEKFVVQVKEMWEDDPFADRWRLTLSRFCEMIGAFWW